MPSNSNESVWRRSASSGGVPPGAEADVRLTDALSRLPEVPVPSNFTARVMNAIDLAEAAEARKAGRFQWRILWPRLVGATALFLLAGVLTLHQFGTSHHPVSLAKNMVQVASAPAQPSVEALENWDAIQVMSHPASADGELLAALQ